MTEPPAEQRDVVDRRKYAKIVAKVWADPEFGERLRASPVELLRSEGIDVPEGTKVLDLSTKANQADRGSYYFLLPAKPASLDEELLVERLKPAGTVAASTSSCCDGNPPKG